MRVRLTRLWAFGLLTCVGPLLPTGASFSHGQQTPVVPGSGTEISFVGDDLENPDWRFIHHHPKSSYKTDDQKRFPLGKSENDRWFEGQERGQPDDLRVVTAPPGGLPGSKWALAMRTRQSGIPGRVSGGVEQDDLVVNSVGRIGVIPVSETPSVVIRIYLPPADEWENRTGPHFGLRAQVTTTVIKQEPRSVGRFRTRSESYRALEPYWPGMWIHFQSGTDQGIEKDSAALTVRGNRLGHDFKVRDIPQSEFGWWTMGMSFTPDGSVHYYARPGVEDLTAADHLASQFPYSYRAEKFENMFFNVCNREDGQNWSTTFVVDDPKIYLGRPERVLAIVKRKQAVEVSAKPSEKR